LNSPAPDQDANYDGEQRNGAIFLSAAPTSFRRIERKNGLPSAWVTATHDALRPRFRKAQAGTTPENRAKLSRLQARRDGAPMICPDERIEFAAGQAAA